MASPDERAGTSGQEQREEIDKKIEALTAGQEALESERLKSVGKSDAPGQRVSPGKTESEDPERSATDSEQGETR